MDGNEAEERRKRGKKIGIRGTKNLKKAKKIRTNEGKKIEMERWKKEDNREGEKNEDDRKDKRRIERGGWRITTYLIGKRRN